MMAKYQLLFSVQPPAVFGLPDEGKTVIPGGNEVFSGSFDTRTGNMVGHGTLSRYREEPLSVTGTAAGFQVRFHDNFLTLEIEDDDDKLVVERGIELVNRLCVLLSMYQGQYFHAETIQATNGTAQTRLLLPKNVHLLTVTAYNLDELAGNIVRTNTGCGVIDPVLDKAMAYFYHALYLWQEADRIRPSSFHGKLVTSETILNCYKATSTILGDPSMDRDYQSRYKQFAMQRTTWEAAERLRVLRNDYDVAHYKPDWAPLEQVQEHIGFAKSTAQSILRLYLEWLLSN